MDSTGADICYSGGRQICSHPPLALKYDYTAVAYGASAFDTLNQTMYVVLSNPMYPGSETLFSIRRYTFLSVTDDPTGQGRISFPLAGIWDVEIQTAAFYAWKFPYRLWTVASMKLAPKQVQLDSSGLFYVDVTSGEKTLFLVATERTADVCLLHRCGYVVTAATATSVTPAGTVCACNNAVVQLNVNTFQVPLSRRVLCSGRFIALVLYFLAFFL